MFAVHIPFYKVYHFILVNLYLSHNSHQIKQAVSMIACNYQCFVSSDHFLESQSHITFVSALKLYYDGPTIV